MPFDHRKPEAAAYLQGSDIDIEAGPGTNSPQSATVWTCDFCADYVAINADYRTWDAAAVFATNRQDDAAASAIRARRSLTPSR